jgi:arylsulfatase A-like enzyme
MPTLLSAAGIEIPTSVSGNSILPYMRGSQDWPEDIFVQISEAQVGRAVRTQRWKYSVVAPDADAIQDSDAKQYHEEYLYDLCSDPYELENLITEPAHRPVADRMQRRLLEWIERIEGKTPTIVAAPVGPATGQRVVLPHEIDE